MSFPPLDDYAGDVASVIDYFGSIDPVERSHVLAARNLAVRRVRGLGDELRILSSEEWEMACDVMEGLSDLIRGMTDPRVVSGQRCLAATFFGNIVEVSDQIDFVEYWFNQAMLLRVE